MEMTWEGDALLKRVEALAIINAERAAEKEVEWLKGSAPVYKGPPRSSGRKPGTLRDGIVARKMRKWTHVYVPSPGAFVEYGGRVFGHDKFNYQEIGWRAPHPFIRPTIKPIMAYFEKLHKEKL